MEFYRSFVFRVTFPFFFSLCFVKGCQFDQDIEESTILLISYIIDINIGQVSIVKIDFIEASWSHDKYHSNILSIWKTLDTWSLCYGLTQRDTYLLLYINHSSNFLIFIVIT